MLECFAASTMLSERELEEIDKHYMLPDDSIETADFNIYDWLVERYNTAPHKG